MLSGSFYIFALLISTVTTIATTHAQPQSQNKALGLIQREVQRQENGPIIIETQTAVLTSEGTVVITTNTTDATHEPQIEHQEVPYYTSEWNDQNNQKIFDECQDRRAGSYQNFDSKYLGKLKVCYVRKIQEDGLIYETWWAQILGGLVKGVITNNQGKVVYKVETILQQRE